MFYIAVVGGSVCSLAEKDSAYAVGAEIARRGGILICGGGSGVMEAAARGAAETGGIAIGILPDDNPRNGNRYLSFAVATGLGEARNVIIARTADVVIAVGGEYGTLSEIALALKMQKKVIGLKSWVIKPPLKLNNDIIQVENPEEAVDKAFIIVKSS